MTRADQNPMLDVCCFRAMKEMGGSIDVAGDGKYMGAAFTLKSPIPE